MSLVSGSTLADCLVKYSPERGCKGGSVATFGHTSESKKAVRSQISLCLSIGKPPFYKLEHDRSNKSCHSYWSGEHWGSTTHSVNEERLEIPLY